MKRYFIVGTDTNCGKTYVTCSLIQYFRALEKRVMALKPVASGCHQLENTWVSEDALQLQKTLEDNTTIICPWSFPLPISPHLAAREAGAMLSSQQIVDFCLKPDWDVYDYLLIEGAGGLMVPLNTQETWIDVLKALDIEVILVVGMRLGCINHALLTISALQQQKIACKGWIANCIDPDMLYLEENIKTLQDKIDALFLGRVGWNSLYFEAEGVFKKNTMLF